MCLQNQMFCHSKSAKISADFAAKKEKYSCITVIWETLKVTRCNIVIAVYPTRTGTDIGDDFASSECAGGVSVISFPYVRRSHAKPR